MIILGISTPWDLFAFPYQVFISYFFCFAGENNIPVPDKPVAGSPGSQGPGVQTVLLPAGEPGLCQVVQHVFRAGRLPGDLLCSVLAHV